MPTASRLLRFALVPLSLSAARCGGGGMFQTADADTSEVAVVDGSRDARVTASDGGAEASAPGAVRLYAVDPEHGPFTGGNVVTLRGTNLSADLEVRFGGNLVQPGDMMLVDRSRLQVKPPAGRAGRVAVSISGAGVSSSVDGAYNYDAFYVDPSSGSIAGGTLLTIYGLNTLWTASTTVSVGGTPCGNVQLVSPSQLTCVTPAGVEGPAPVTVSTGSEDVTVPGAYTYRQTGDTNNGGFAGGPIRGSINVSVYDAIAGVALPTALVWIGDDPYVGPPQEGITNLMGQVVLSVPNLRGPLTINATAKCHASSTFQLIDGTDATIFLMPWLNLVPGVDCGHGMPNNPPRPPYYGSDVAGELIWDGPAEFGPNPWVNIPSPRANERRVAYVMSTTPGLGGGNPDPGPQATVQEVIPRGYAGRGYAYQLNTRNGTMAVYAIAGLERMDVSPPRFTPYVMGVARGVLTTPRAHVTGVNVFMNIPLDHETEVVFSSLPPAVGGQPNRYRVEGWIDLGGEGVIPRPDSTVVSTSVDAPFHLVALPGFEGTLADARLTVRSMFGSGDGFNEPSSTVMSAGITNPDAQLRVSQWTGIPALRAPAEGGALPEDRTVRFDLLGSNPDLVYAMLAQGSSSCLRGAYYGDVVWWQNHQPGAGRTLLLPDLSSVPTLVDMPRGLYNLSLCSLRINGFDYNNFRYAWLTSGYWSAWSSDTFTVAR